MKSTHVHAARTMAKHCILAYMLGEAVTSGSAQTLTGSPQGGTSSEFFAYYTRVESGEAFEQYCRTGENADIVVQVGQPAGRLVFGRGSSYLPCWETATGKWFLDEIVPRSGDGTDLRPDRVNALSRVALIESTPQRVLISWRYLPEFAAGNPYAGLDPARMVDERFEVFVDGKITRTVKQGTPKIDDWNDPFNQTVQTLQLAPGGVSELSRTAPAHSAPPAAVIGSPLKGPPVTAPLRAWNFDEAAGDVTSEAVGGQASTIAGRKSLWRKGVSGTCLQFDGYDTSISLPKANAPNLTESITLEAWIAIGAYPWNWATVIQQGDDDGYFLGINGAAQAGFKLKIGGIWQELVATNVLARFRWQHLVGTYERSTGTMSLYLDGQAVATKALSPAGLQTTGDPIQIGKGKIGSLPSYAFDGLIDEVGIYGQALTPAQVADSYQKFAPSPELATAPDMEQRALPTFDSGGRFGASYTRLANYDVWDNLWCAGPYEDVVVGFDQSPAKFVFWRGAGHIPMLANEKNQWYSNEFNETWGTSGGSGCQEPMSDKKSLFNHVRVIENTPARVVVHWRFPLINVNHIIANFNSTTGWGDWADWYYTIYPDGVAVKKMHLWTNGSRNHEWHESMAILGANQHPEQVLETDPALVMADLNGNATAYSWKAGPPGGVNFNKQIQVVKYRANYHPFTIHNFTGGNVYGGASSYSVFPAWNHWPEAQIPTDIHVATFPDRASHCSLTHLFMNDYSADYGDRPFQEKLLMEGMTPLSAGELAPLAKSWLQAPALSTLADCGSTGYDQSQRAYVLSATGPSPTFRIAAAPANPLVNPCFVVRNWDLENAALLEVNGVGQNGGPQFRQGIVRDTTGRKSLIVWLELQSMAPITFTLCGKPAAPSGLIATPARGAVALNWTASIGATSYHVCISNSVSGAVRIEPCAAPPCTQTGLDIGTAYSFKVSATNSVGESDYSAEVSATPTETKADQTITFAAGATLSKTLDAEPFADRATADSGLPVTYSSDNPNVAAVHADTGVVTLVGPGTARILANQAGDGSFNPAPQAAQTLTVTKVVVPDVIATVSNSPSRVVFENTGSLAGAVVFGNAGSYDGIAFKLWSSPFATPKLLGSGVSVVANANTNAVHEFGGGGQYQHGAYTSAGGSSTLTFSGMDSAKRYRFQFAYCDKRHTYPYNAAVTLTSSTNTIAAPTLRFGDSAAYDYAMLTVTVAGSTGLTLDMPRSGNTGPSVAGFSVHEVPLPTDPFVSWINGFNWLSLTHPDKTPTGDPDGDGMNNQEEYAFGLDPTLGSSVNPITDTSALRGGTFSYTRRANSGLTYKVLSSPDLVLWMEDTQALQTPGAALAGIETVAVTLPSAVPPAGKRFVRVEAR